MKIAVCEVYSKHDHDVVRAMVKVADDGSWEIRVENITGRSRDWWTASKEARLNPDNVEWRRPIHSSHSLPPTEKQAMKDVVRWLAK